ncbi:type I-C CRISPR-associated protein Cas8c/Csd1 [Plantactinospora sp. S1510]|uniref:Type I-C CRISPR-associated protein Cas8c/Csd1 n=1 Tax=Plantactinospora alkalitolerans TaxID=2789879 RepID=A0ABS0HAU9_9ACTN|nr:type I-C CRISPR-associated protein Cas8c/Csd1 [Plantactinospora alkalitolerans]MBF9135237.1 type I-C CRISPR-associated protein Cas8c/Csd1 [Plantactinospora alkalitolerans]
MNIFASLTRYAATVPELPPPCYRERRIDWALHIRYVTNDNSPRIDIEPWGEMSVVPTMRRSGPKPMPLLCVDNAAYVLGQAGVGASEAQATSRTKAFWDQMGQWLASEHRHPALGAAIVLLQTHGRIETEHEVDARNVVGVRIDGIWLHESPEAVRFWVETVTRLKGGQTGLCVSCGQIRILAATLPNAIPAHLVPGAAWEVQLSVLTEAERKTAGSGLPICVACGDRATVALQHLLADKRRTQRMHGQNSATVSWGLDPDADEAVLGLLSQVMEGRTN